MLRLLPWGPDYEVRDLIRSGNVVYELARPLHLYSLWYARAIAQQTAPTLLRSVPMVILAMLFFGMRPPESLACFGAWVLCTFGAILLASAITTFTTITMLWTVAGDGAAALVGMAVWFFSGMVIPLPLFPDALRRVMDLLPFRGIVDIPFRLYVGNIPAVQAPALFAFQLAWTIVLVITGRLLLARHAPADRAGRLTCRTPFAFISATSASPSAASSSTAARS